MPTPAAREKAILVVTDKPEWVAALRQAAEGTDHAVVVADGDETTLGLVKQIAPVGILLDVGLPRREGWVLLDRLKHDPQLRHVPVCVIGSPEERLPALERGAVLHLETGAERQGATQTVEKVRSLLQRTSRNLLLVEGESATPARLGDLLGTEGVTLEQVPSLATAAVALEGRRFDCLVLHVEGGAPAEVERLAAIPADTPVVVYSADGGTPRRCVRWLETAW